MACKVRGLRLRPAAYRDRVHVIFPRRPEDPRCPCRDATVAMVPVIDRRDHRAVRRISGAAWVSDSRGSFPLQWHDGCGLFSVRLEVPTRANALPRNKQRRVGCPLLLYFSFYCLSGRDQVVSGQKRLRTPV